MVTAEGTSLEERLKILLHLNCIRRKEKKTKKIPRSTADNSSEKSLGSTLVLMWHVTRQRNVFAPVQRALLVFVRSLARKEKEQLRKSSPYLPTGL